MKLSNRLAKLEARLVQPENRFEGARERLAAFLQAIADRTGNETRQRLKRDQHGELPARRPDEPPASYLTRIIEEVEA